MSIYPNVTEEVMNNLVETAEQQKNQRAVKLQKKKLKQTLDKKSAVRFESIPKKITELNDSTGNINK